MKKKFEKAISPLKMVSESLYLKSEKAQWLLSLSYLFNGDSVPARNILNSIVEDSEHSYFEEASALVKKLE
jgi:Tfp pilus assembly protein FimV